MAENKVTLIKYVTGYELKVNGFPVQVDWTSTDKEAVITQAQAILLADSTTVGGLLDDVIVTEDLLITHLNDGTPLNFTEASDRINIHYEDHS